MRYRDDIDGLRAIAIASVVFFHAGFHGFSGGFVGVDIFFVVSGYLITSWIRDRIANDSFTFRGFYLNRLRRLAPSFFLMLIFVWIGGFLLVDEREFVNLGKALASSLVFVSNWFFLTQNGYFDSALESNPMLHSWSLSVEEQFYLLWPLALFLLSRMRWNGARWRTMTVLGLLLSSLLASVLMAKYASPKQAFFNSGGRAWELLAGAAISLGIVKPIETPASAFAMRIFGLLLLGVSITFYSAKMAYPGAFAIAPVLGTFLLIAASGEARDPVYRVLASGPFRFIGQISYSLYLWHWPLLVFAKMRYPDISLVGRASVIGIAFLLAGATTVLFEMPVRRREIWKSERPFTYAVGLALAAFLALGVTTVAKNGMPSRWQDVDVNADVANETGDDFARNVSWGQCFLEDNPLANLTEHCLAPEPGKKNILLIGDSFAAHLMPGLRRDFPEYHFAQATAATCRARIDMWRWGRFNCPELNRLLFSTTIKNPAYDAILLVSDWQPDDQLNETYAAIRDLTRTPIIVFGNTPAYAAPPAIVLRKNFLTGATTAAEPPPMRAGLWETNERLKDSPGPAIFVSLLDNFCPNRQCPLLTPDGHRVHGDWGHLTSWGSIAVIDASKTQIAAALPKSKTAKGESDSQKILDQLVRKKQSDA